MLSSEASFDPECAWAQRWLTQLRAARQLAHLNHLYVRGELVRGPLGHLIDLFHSRIPAKDRQLVSGLHGDYLTVEGTASALPGTVRRLTGLPMHPAFLTPMKRVDRKPWMRLENLHFVVDVELVTNYVVSPRELADLISRSTRVREAHYTE